MHDQAFGSKQESPELKPPVQHEQQPPGENRCKTQQRGNHEGQDRNPARAPPQHGGSRREKEHGRAKDRAATSDQQRSDVYKEPGDENEKADQVQGELRADRKSTRLNS